MMIERIPMFVVLCRTNLDDFPMYVCQTREGADAFAERVTPRQIRRYGRDVFGVDEAGLTNVAIVEFGADGIPTEMEIVRDLDQPKKGRAK
jgi:hypothetical protein